MLAAAGRHAQADILEPHNFAKRTSSLKRRPLGALPLLASDRIGTLISVSTVGRGVRGHTYCAKLGLLVGWQPGMRALALN
jgi:hypothetical protein